LIQEIREMQAPEPPLMRVHVIRVQFDPDGVIPEDIREEISTQLRTQLFERYASAAYLEDLAGEIAEVGVMGALQNRGYFRTRATAKVTRLEREGADVNVAVAISVALGTQYRTGDVRVESADEDVRLAISAEVLRELIPLHSGELFSAEKVRTGMETLTRAYSREGYVDMVAEPKTAIHEGLKTVDLMYRIDQGIQYRVARVGFLGVNSVTGDELWRSLPKSGDIFDGSRLEEFFRLNWAILPPDATRDDVTVARDVRTRTVAILFDFRKCPPN
jgi:outer membrane translocation and assembly module TamA